MQGSKQKRALQKSAAREYRGLNNALPASQSQSTHPVEGRKRAAGGTIQSGEQKEGAAKSWPVLRARNQKCGRAKG
jgi:hypothetical protein